MPGEETNLPRHCPPSSSLRVDNDNGVGNNNKDNNDGNSSPHRPSPSPPPPPPPLPVAAATPEQLSHLHSLLLSSNNNKPPLARVCQKVMVPLTTKAFFEGTLCPFTTTTRSDPSTPSPVPSEGKDQAASKNETNDDDDDDDDDEKEESEKEAIFLANLGCGYYTELTRNQCSKFLERRKQMIMKMEKNDSALDENLLSKQKKSSATINDKSSGSRERRDYNAREREGGGWNKGFLNRKKAKRQKDEKTDDDGRATTEEKQQQPQTMKQQQQPREKKKELSSSSSSSLSSIAASSNSTSGATSLPFFEIREEYDSRGKILRAEAVNVAKELQSIRKEVRNKAASVSATNAATECNDHDDTGEEEEDDDDENYNDKAKRKKGANDIARELDHLMESLTVSEEVSDATPSVQTDNEKDTVTEHSNEYESIKKVNQQQQYTTKMSDEQYSMLSARLEELARLEEQDEQNKQVNVLSSKKLQSKGWNKGFLQKDVGKQKKEKKIVEKKDVKLIHKTTEKKNTDEDIVPVDQPTITNTQALKNRDGAANVATNTMEMNEKKPVVAFCDVNEVREIPRIGQMSINTVRKMQQRQQPPPQRHHRKQPQQQQQQPLQQQPKHDGPSDIPVDAPPSKKSNTFGTDVFTGVVTERLPQEMEHTSIMADQPSEEKKKKVSRFAQERRQREGGQEEFMVPSSMEKLVSAKVVQDKTQVSRFRQEQHERQVGTTTQPTPTVVMLGMNEMEQEQQQPPPTTQKRLSRFAQERQQMREQMPAARQAGNSFVPGEQLSSLSPSLSPLSSTSQPQQPQQVQETKKKKISRFAQERAELKRPT